MAYKFSFSYSKYSTWAKCPKQFKLKTIDKLDTGPTPKALLEGRKIHDAIGNYLMGKEAEPERLAKHFSILGKQLCDIYGAGGNTSQLIVEEQMAFDKEKRRVKWFGPNAYYRFIWDACLVDHATGEANAIDWKTGKPYGSYDDQMEIFAIPAFWQFPELKKFTGRLMYLDSGDVSEPYTFTREQFDEMVWPKWRTNIAMFESDTTFQATPSKQACQWCDFGPAKLGVCQEAV